MRKTRNDWRFGLAIVATLVVAGAARAVTPMPDDEVLAISPDDVPKLWTLVKKDPKIRLDNPSKYRAGCASFAYIIESNGKTNGVSVMRAWPDDDFGDAVARYVRRWRFEPTAANKSKQPIYTVQLYTLTLDGTDSELGSHIKPKVDTEELAKLCAVKSLHIGN